MIRTVVCERVQRVFTARLIMEILYQLSWLLNRLRNDVCFWSVFLIIAQYLIHKNHTLPPFYIDKKQFKTVKTIKNVIRRMSLKLNHFNEHKKVIFMMKCISLQNQKVFLKKLMFELKFFKNFNNNPTKSMVKDKIS